MLGKVANGMGFELLFKPVQSSLNLEAEKIV
jgi:hypothetical protein